MRTTIWLVGLVLVVGCQRNRARDCAPYAHDPVLDVCVCPEGTRLADGGVDCVEYDGGVVLSCAGGAPAVTVYADADGDGHGNAETERMGCPGEAGTSMLGDDCDDACASCRPGGSEVCDGKDNDCASGADDTFACVQGTTSACTTTCGTAGTGACSAECTMPAACAPPTEVCNEEDDDCDDLVDEGVVQFGERVGYAIEGDMLAAVASAPELALISHDVRGIHLQRFAEDGTLTLSRIGVLEGVFSSAAASVSGSDRALIAAIGDTTQAITIAEIDVRTGAVVQGPRSIGTRSGGGLEQIRIVNASVPLVLYNSSEQIFARGGTWTGSFSERVVASGIEGFARFDAVADPAAISSAYVAFAAYVGGDRTNPEVFVQRVSGFGESMGAAHRVTTNGVSDVDPTVGWNGTDLSVVWFQGSTTSSLVGAAGLQVVAPTGSGAWTVRGEARTEMASQLYGSMRAARRGTGLSLLWTGAGPSGESAVAHIAPCSADGSAVGQAQVLDPAEPMSFGYAMMREERGIVAFYVAVRGEDDFALFGRRLMCP